MAVEIDDTALYFFNAGECAEAYAILGAHRAPGQRGKLTSPAIWRFTVWAPHAKAVHVAGSFNDFSPVAMPMRRMGDTGIWEVSIPNVCRGDLYKYVITGQDGNLYWRTDPYATRTEYPPGKASMVWGIPKFKWNDAIYYNEKKRADIYKTPMSIYEVHVGSFKSGLNYKELAKELVQYAVDMGYTHLELLPLCEYPLPASWGYQVTGYFAATSRYGEPEELQYLVDYAHRHGLGVLLDWVPAHFPRDEHGLRLYDGTPLYEHADKRRGEQPQWGTMLFDYGRTQVQSFLLSNAFFWLKEFHFDGLRMDAVSCMLYLDYGKKHGEWCANEHGGRENLDAIAFIRKLSSRMRETWPNNERLLIAEESTAFPYVTRPASEGGLGFHFKWNMGWMNDTLSYMENDPYFRKWNHDKLTFSLTYAFSERFILPFSHDEVVHGKRSMVDKMPGDYWRKFAQLRLALAYQYAHPGKKLNFMGNEFAQFIEWRFDEALDWHLLAYPKHSEMHRFCRELNLFYKATPALYERDDDWGGFEWICVNDNIHSVAAFIRRDDAGNALLCMFNFTPNPWENYELYTPFHCLLTQALSTDALRFGGTGEWDNTRPVTVAHKGSVRLPPLGAVFFTLDVMKPGMEMAAGE